MRQADIANNFCSQNVCLATNLSRNKKVANTFWRKKFIPMAAYARDMVINFKSKTLQQYLDQLSRKEPVPGGGSAAALTGALAVGLISMVANYSLNRKSNTPSANQRFQKILDQSQQIRLRLLELTSLDSEAYLKLTAARNLDEKAQKEASRAAGAVPQEVCKLCSKALSLTPFLVEKGNPYLLSDVEVALELLLAAFNGARVMVRVNS